MTCPGCGTANTSGWCAEVVSPACVTPEMDWEATADTPKRVCTPYTHTGQSTLTKQGRPATLASGWAAPNPSSRLDREAG